MTNVSPYLRLVPRTEAAARKAILSRYAPAESTFARTLSITTRDLPWEDRAKPVEPLWKMLMAGVFFVVFLTGVMALVGMFGG